MTRGRADRMRRAVLKAALVVLCLAGFGAVLVAGPARHPPPATGVLPQAIPPQTVGSVTRTEPRGAAELALGLSGVVDWTVQQPFLDVMKTARPWIGHLPGQWGGQTEAELAAAGLLDARGWPVSMPAGLDGIGTVVLNDLPEAAVSLAGRYRLRFRGNGVVEVGGRAHNIRHGNNEVLFDFSPGPGPVVVTITRTDPRSTGDPVQDISIVKLENADRFDAGEIFNPDWIGRIRDFGALRFMDWMNINDSTQSDWADRPRPGDYTYARNGVPLEIMVRLANDLGADPWFNMPHRATDDYIRAFAGAVRDTLDPGLTAYVEYSNEVWNWQFTQAVWAEERSAARWGVEYGWMQYYGLRTAQMARIWKDAFGAGAASRLVTVISTQTGWQGLETYALEAPLWVAEDPQSNRRPAEEVDAYAIAGYFGRVLGTPERAGVVRDWIAQSRRAAMDWADARGLTGSARADAVAAHEFDAAIATAARELRDGSVTGQPEDTLADLLGNTFPYHADIARAYGLDLIMYEGGSHIAGVAEIIDDDDLTRFFVSLNYAPEMGDLYRELLTGWHDAGGRLFNVYADVVQPGKWGSWGGLRHLDDQNPRWDAILDFDPTRRSVGATGENR